MIKYKTGNILTDDAEAIVNTVNCVGVMGRGIALQFKKAFPENYKAYSDACKREEVQPGHMFIFETNQLAGPRYIINFPTKRHWRGKSKMGDIDSGLNALADEIRVRKIHSISIPPLGSGLGGLNWVQVRPRIEKALKELEDVQITIFEPKGAPISDKMVHTREVPNMTPGRAALIGLMNRYLSGLLDPFVTLLELHKLMYFMQELGEPLKLQITKADYGPYAENLRHVLHAIEGHFIHGYADGGDAPDKQLSLTPGAVQDADSFLETHAETHKRFNKVSELIEGFESPFGLELLATVHWIVIKENTLAIEDIIKKTYAWNVRKRQFTHRQIKLAYDVLKHKGWIDDASVPG